MAIKIIFLTLLVFSNSVSIFSQDKCPVLESEAQKYLLEVVKIHKEENLHKKEILVYMKTRKDNNDIYVFKFREYITIITKSSIYCGEFEGYSMIYSDNRESTHLDSNELQNLRVKLNGKVENGNEWLDKLPKFVDDIDKNGKAVKIKMDYNGDYVKGGEYILTLKDGKRVSAYQGQ